MTSTSEPDYKIAVYTSDLWEHVCPTIRMVEPVQEAGMRLIRGNEWDNSQIQVRPNYIEEADLVVMMRDFPKHIDFYENIVAYARRLGKPVVYELDDNLLELGAFHPDTDHYLETRPSILRAVLEADAVTTTTAPLADYLRAYNPNVYILPNFLIDKFWMGIEPAKEAVPANSPIKIGYMGGHSHAPDIEWITPVLKQLLECYGDRISLQFWGLRPGDDLSNRPNVRWTHPYLVNYFEFARYFAGQACDIFIAPLQDNLFNRCKSGLKYLEYSVMGIPGVYSNIFPYREMINSGDNGFLVTGPDEWEAKLSQLIENADLRTKMGRAARRAVEEKWLLSRNVHRWTDVYRQILKGQFADQETLSENAHQFIRKSQRWYIDLAQRVAFQKSRIQELEVQVLAKQEVNAQLDVQVQGLEKQIEFKDLQRNSLEYHIRHQQHKIDQLEMAAEVLRNQIVEKGHETTGVENSLAWKLAVKLLVLRSTLAPNGSFRERLFRRTVNGLLIWRRHGFRAMLKNVLSRISSRSTVEVINPPVQPSLSGINYIAANGVRSQSPAFSILLVNSQKDADIESDRVREWLNRQTLSSWEFVIWDRVAGKVWMHDRPDFMWFASSISELVLGLSGKYVCMASADLIQQNETFLEYNLVALESENLIFTVNVNGNTEWVKYFFEKGLFPGSMQYPLQRTCVSTSFLKENFEIDLTSRFRALNDMDSVVGKIIVHTTPEKDMEGSISLDTRLNHCTVTILGHSIVARPEHAQPAAGINHVIYPVDQVIPIVKSGDNRPTMIVFMPFLAVGGAERVALDMIDYLKDDIRFVVLTLDDHDPAIGTTVNAFRKLTPFVYTARDFLNFNLNFSMVNYLIEKFTPHTFYIANGSPWIFDALTTIKQFHPELRLACQVYDHNAGWINRYDPSIAGIMDANIGVNKKICDAFIERGVRQEAAYQIENGVNTNEYDPGLYDEERKNSIKQKLNLPAGKKIVVFMARIHPQKRPMDFVEAARRCSEDPHLHFLMVGDGPLGKTIDEEIAKIGLQNITRLSFYRPSSDIYAICDVFVLPSEYEGMPMVILEAQAMGKPVVVTEAGNNREVLDVTNGGICVKKIGSISDLQQGIYKMLSAPPDPAAIRNAILDHFSMKVMGENYRKALLGN